MRYCGGLCLRGDDAPDGEEISPCVGVSRQSLEGSFSETHIHTLANLYGSGAYESILRSGTILSPGGEGGPTLPSGFLCHDDACGFLTPLILGNRTSGIWRSRKHGAFMVATEARKERTNESRHGW